MPQGFRYLGVPSIALLSPTTGPGHRARARLGVGVGVRVAQTLTLTRTPTPILNRAPSLTPALTLTLSLTTGPALGGAPAVRLTGGGRHTLGGLAGGPHYRCRFGNGTDGGYGTHQP